MGRCNIKNRKTGQWRCWSTIIDDWVSEWMPEHDYKEWLIVEAARMMREELETFGIREPRSMLGTMTASSCNYHKALEEYCSDCCHDDCDNCYYNKSFESYIAEGNNYFNIDLEE